MYLVVILIGRRKALAQVRSIVSNISGQIPCTKIGKLHERELDVLDLVIVNLTPVRCRFTRLVDALNQPLKEGRK